MARMAPGGMPKSSPEAAAAFSALVPDGPGVAQRPMFGNRAAFVNGNMFAGLFGEALFVRLPEAGLEAVLGAGGRPFEPMPGRPMRGYAFVPEPWRDSQDARRWVREALEHTAALPAKAAKPARRK